MIEINPPKLPVKEFDNEWEEYENDDEQEISIPDIEDTMDSHGRLLNQQPYYDNLIHKKVQLQLRDKVQREKVIQRSFGPDGITLGTYDDNPSLNSILYDVELPDGTIIAYATNIIS